MINHIQNIMQKQENKYKHKLTFKDGKLIKSEFIIHDRGNTKYKVKTP